MHELSTIGPDIAKHLPGWRHVELEEYQTSYLVPDGQEWTRGGMSIHLQADTYHKRIHISGSWPYSDHGCTTPRDVGAESPSITVSLDKDPKKIAADIQRRFLPHYLDIYPKCVAKIEHDKAGEARQHTVAKEFAKIMGDQTKNAHASWYGKDCYGHVDVNWGGDSATLELRGNVAILRAALVAAGKAGAFNA